MLKMNELKNLGVRTLTYDWRFRSCWRDDDISYCDTTWACDL
jgi:hypothetical protein